MTNFKMLYPEYSNIICDLCKQHKETNRVYLCKQCWSNLSLLKKGSTILIIAKRWFNGNNTYHSVAVYVNGKLLERYPFMYGYGLMYLQNAQRILSQHYRNIDRDEPLFRYKDSLQLEIFDDVTDVKRKKDL